MASVSGVKNSDRHSGPTSLNTNDSNRRVIVWNSTQETPKDNSEQSRTDNYLNVPGSDQTSPEVGSSKTTLLDQQPSTSNIASSTTQNRFLNSKDVISTDSVITLTDQSLTALQDTSLSQESPTVVATTSTETVLVSAIKFRQPQQTLLDQQPFTDASIQHTTSDKELLVPTNSAITLNDCSQQILLEPSASCISSSKTETISSAIHIPGRYYSLIQEALLNQETCQSINRDVDRKFPVSTDPQYQQVLQEALPEQQPSLNYISSSGTKSDFSRKNFVVFPSSAIRLSKHQETILPEALRDQESPLSEIVHTNADNKFLVSSATKLINHQPILQENNLVDERNLQYILHNTHISQGPVRLTENLVVVPVIQQATQKYVNNRASEIFQLPLRISEQGLPVVSLATNCSNNKISCSQQNQQEHTLQRKVLQQTDTKTNLSGQNNSVKKLALQQLPSAESKFGKQEIIILQKDHSSKGILQQSSVDNTPNKRQIIYLNKTPVSCSSKTDVLLTNSLKKRSTTMTRIHNPPPVAVARRNARERNRVKQVNNGFANLRQHIPTAIAASYESGNGRGNNKKLSKVETLRMAVEYIKSLEKLLSISEENSSSSSTSQTYTSSLSPVSSEYIYSYPKNDEDLRHQFKKNSFDLIYEDEENIHPLKMDSMDEDMLVNSNLELTDSADISLLHSIDNTASLSPEVYSEHSLSPAGTDPNDAKSYIPVFNVPNQTVLPSFSNLTYEKLPQIKSELLSPSDPQTMIEEDVHSASEPQTVYLVTRNETFEVPHSAIDVSWWGQPQQTS